MTDWTAITKRNARSVQTTIGWIFWDPVAAQRYAALGIPGEFAVALGYIAARCAPLAPAGPAAVTAAFGSISPLGINAIFSIFTRPEQFQQIWVARNEAVAEGLALYAPNILDPLEVFHRELWAVVHALPLEGRVLFGALLAQEEPDDPVLSGWHAINCLREWRGDTHWAITVSHNLTHAESSILHNAWLGYEENWIPKSRGISPEALQEGWRKLERRGLAANDHVNDNGIQLRQEIEDETDLLTTLPWELLGEQRSITFAELFEPPCEQLLQRVDATAGPNYQPASRIHF
jgi:hypothetical protein